MSDLPYKTTADKIAYWMLRPGDWICDVFKVEETYEKRFLLRLFINLGVYAKVFGGLAFYFALKL